MSFTPKTPKDDHFVSNPDLDILNHRPHKAAVLLYNAMTATAVFTIWLIYCSLLDGLLWSAV